VSGAASDDGFTLVELLIVIIILGILVAIVMFSVSGFRDQSTTAASSTDHKTVVTAEAAYFAKHSCYTDGPGLVTAGVLHEVSTYWSATTSGGACPASYSMTAVTTTTTATCSLSAASLGPAAVRRADTGAAGPLAEDVVVSATTGSCSAVTAAFDPHNGHQNVGMTGGPTSWHYTIAAAADTWVPGTYTITVTAGATQTPLTLVVCSAPQASCP
jgi:general secretion pathway protein G